MVERFNGRVAEVAGYGASKWVGRPLTFQRAPGWAHRCLRSALRPTFGSKSRRNHTKDAEN
jgi:hypothetical protein